MGRRPEKGLWLGIFQGLADAQVLLSARAFDKPAGMGDRLHFSSVHLIKKVRSKERPLLVEQRKKLERIA